jgi:hypothetical protein
LTPSSQPGPLATMSSADYAQLLKTLCLDALLAQIQIHSIAVGALVLYAVQIADVETEGGSVFECARMENHGAWLRRSSPARDWLRRSTTRGDGQIAERKRVTRLEKAFAWPRFRFVFDRRFA